MLGNINRNLNLDNHIPVIHKYIHKKILSKDSKLLKDLPKDEMIIARACIKKFLSRYMIPLEIQTSFLKEMESYGLLKILDKQTIEMLEL